MGRTPGVPNWTPEEEELLRQLLPQMLVKHIAVRFKRTPAAIYSKVYDMGISDKKHWGRCDPSAAPKPWRLRNPALRPDRWKPEDVEMLKRLAPRMLNKNLALVFKRSRFAVGRKLQALGVAPGRGRHDPNLKPRSGRKARPRLPVCPANPIPALSTEDGITAHIDRMMHLAALARKAA